MREAIISLLESWGATNSNAVSQADFLTDLPLMLFTVWETVYAPALATVFAYILGLPLGIILVTGEEGGIRPLPRLLMKVLNTAINLLRSVPFLILMVVVMPLSRAILGSSVGTSATIVPLTVAAAPYVARLVEASLREMDRGVIEAAQA
ncbi:MAG: ABC transporter permease, partial [Oscillospiraceae bacterium]|nr:ABC transporter permease [Oscillospiraceae bacterium]